VTDAQVLAGRSAVVAGGSRGIGAGVARGLAAAGSMVTVWARDPAVPGSPAGDGDGYGVVCDVRSRSSVAAAVTETIRHRGHIDVLVVAAGRGGSDRLFPDEPDEDWDDIIATNLTGAFNVVKPVASHMIERGHGGKIILVSSIAADFAMPRAVGYAAAKAAFRGFTRSVAAALARHDIQVNSVLPGWVRTDMTRGMLAERDQEMRLVHRTPARRLGTPEDVAGVCVYLASDASRFHTGDEICIDGGFSIA
jgi:NAD(P)-dependent dehydrogenase (short-subunit alcohol dehydrogenase family)